MNSLYVLCGDEILLVNESLDALRQNATKAGYLERINLSLDARADWSALKHALQSVSLFNDKRLVCVQIPSGKPGRNGGEALQELASLAQNNQLTDSVVIVVLPRLDRATKNSKWAKSLLSAAVVTEHPSISRNQLPNWIQQRLTKQNQSVDNTTLEWLADKVEGHLLAAHQEILKLGMLYPQGHISSTDVETAVLDVARYNVFDLRDAMLAGHTKRTLNILEGLKAEGAALPLVLWAIGDEIRILACLAAARQNGQLQAELKRQRVFYAREALVRGALDRVASNVWPAAVKQAHDIDRLIKGLYPSGRLRDAWAEMSMLIMRIAYSPN